MNHPMNKSQQENMMPASYLKYKTLVASETRCVDLLPSRPSVMFGLIGALLIAVPLPAFAESGSSDNISIALSSSVVGNPIEQDDVSNTAPGAIVDFSSCCQRANRTRRAGHIFRDQRQGSGTSFAFCGRLAREWQWASCIHRP